MKQLLRTVAILAAVAAASRACADDLDDLIFDDPPSPEPAQTPEPQQKDEEERQEDDAGADNAVDDAAAQQDGDAGGEDGVVAEASAAVAKTRRGGAERPFRALPSCSSAEGTVEVMSPGSKSWVPAVEKRHYALGSVFRTVGAGSKLVLSFGIDAELELSGDAAIATRALPVGAPNREVVLMGGAVSVKLPGNLPKGLFSVNTPGFSAYDLSGESVYVHEAKGDGDLVSVSCRSGSLSIKGRHFEILPVKPQQEVKIRTSQDVLFTGIYGVSGDMTARLDQGAVRIKDFETGESRTENKVLDWKLTPRTAVRIHRSMPAIGDKMSVSVMTFDEAGNLRNECAFAENTVEVNTGEIGPTSKKEREELAKRAAEAAKKDTAAEAKANADENGEADGE